MSHGDGDGDASETINDSAAAKMLSRTESEDVKREEKKKKDKLIDTQVKSLNVLFKGIKLQKPKSEGCDEILRQYHRYRTTSQIE